MNENPNIGPGGEILDAPMGVQTQPQGMGVQAINHGQAAAMAAAQAMVQTRFQMALMRPRNVFQARSKILDACRRPGFAESAIYRKPVGKVDGQQTYAEGPSIRFAEEALRSLGNVDIRQEVVFEDDAKRVVCVTVLDLENNVGWPTEISIVKRVERRFVKEGQTVHGKRKNSYGKDVFIVDATEDEVTVKQQAMVSKALRTAALRIVPGDILEEAINLIKETLSKKDQADPKAALKRVLDAFQGLGVGPSELEKYLDHSLDTITPVEIGELRGIYQSLKDGDSTWKTVMDSVLEEREARKEKKDGGGKTPAEPKGEGDTTKDAPATPGAKETAADKAKNKAQEASAKMGPSATLPLEG